MFYLYELKNNAFYCLKKGTRPQTRVPSSGTVAPVTLRGANIGFPRPMGATSNNSLRRQTGQHHSPEKYRFPSVFLIQYPPNSSRSSQILQSRHRARLSLSTAVHLRLIWMRRLLCRKHNSQPSLPQRCRSTRINIYICIMVKQNFILKNSKDSL